MRELRAETHNGAGDNRIVCRGQESREEEMVISAQGGWLAMTLTQKVPSELHFGG